MVRNFNLISFIKIHAEITFIFIDLHNTERDKVSRAIVCTISSLSINVFQGLRVSFLSKDQLKKLVETTCCTYT